MSFWFVEQPGTSQNSSYAPLLRADPHSGEEQETAFLCGAQRTRHYGTTSTTRQRGEKVYQHTVKHPVQKTDTLNSIALKYHANIMEIKRLNKLFSNEAMYLKDFLLIPVDDVKNAPDFVRQQLSLTSTSTHNGSSECSTTTTTSSSERPDSLTFASSGRHSDGSQRSTTSGGSFKDARLANESFNDILSRIDSTIRTTAENVKQLHKQSTIDSALDTSPTSSRVSNASHHSSMTHSRSFNNPYQSYQNS